MKPQSAKAKKCRRCKDVVPIPPDKAICSYCSSHCSTCGTELTPENWDNSGRHYRKQYRCKSCVSNGVKTTRGNSGFCQKSYDYKRNYGLTIEEAESLKSNGCEICGSYKNLCIDHCHRTGKVRGCLCAKCNSALGMFNDDTDRIEKAKRYLDSFKEK